MNLEKKISITKKYGVDVVENEEMDKLRRENCLCFNCGRKDDSPPYSSCPVAKKIYDVCIDHDMAMAITRCGAKDEHGELLYKSVSKEF